MDPETTTLPTPDELRSYAIDRGWQPDDELSACGYSDVFVHEDLVASIDLSDPREALQALAYAEGRTSRELALDIISQRTPRAYA